MTNASADLTRAPGLAPRCCPSHSRGRGHVELRECDDERQLLLLDGIGGGAGLRNTVMIKEHAVVVTPQGAHECIVEHLR